MGQPYAGRTKSNSPGFYTYDSIGRSAHPRWNQEVYRLLEKLSDDERVYRLLGKDMCLFSASCIMHSLQFDVMIQAEKDTSFWLIPTDTYKKLMSESVVISNYTNEILASRMSDVVWLMEQVMWQSSDVRLATFLLEESALEGSTKLSITHEEIANHLGTAREVVTRMLKYFQSEGLVTLSRGSLEIINPTGLKERQN